MRWSVEGANEESGEEVAMVIEAATRAQAEAEARSRGAMVAAVMALEPKSPLDELADIQQSLGDSGPVAYDRSRTKLVVPRYLGLRIASSVLMVIAVTYYLLGGFAAVVAVVALIERPAKGPYSGLGVTIMSLATIVGIVSVGGICHGLSAACTALRDIAINSFARRS